MSMYFSLPFLDKRGQQNNIFYVKNKLKIVTTKKIDLYCHRRASVIERAYNRNEPKKIIIVGSSRAGEDRRTRNYVYVGK